MIEDGTAIGSALATAVNRLRAVDAPRASSSSCSPTGRATPARSRRRPPPTRPRRSASRSTPSAPARAAWRRIPTHDLFGNKVYRPMQVDIDEDDAAEDRRRRPAAATSAPPTPTSLRADLRRDRSQPRRRAFEAPQYLDYHELYPWLAVAGARAAAARDRARRDRAAEAAVIAVARSRACSGGARRWCRRWRAFFVWALRRRRAARSQRFVAAALLPTRRARRRPAPPHACAPRCCVRGRWRSSSSRSAGPMWGFHWEEVQREGIDLIVALDTSRSMLADRREAEPPRARQARGAGPGDAAAAATASAWCAFAGTAFVQCPLTLDYGAFAQSLDAVEVGIIPRGGTALAAAIDTEPRRVRGPPGQARGAHPHHRRRGPRGRRSTTRPSAPPSAA